MNLRTTFSKKLEVALRTYIENGNFDIDTFTAAATNVLTTPAPHNLSIGDRVRVITAGVLPGGLALATNYFVIEIPTSTTFKVSATSGGPELDITDAGTGTHTVQWRPRWVDGSDSWVVFEYHTTTYENVNQARFFVLVEAGPESGPLVHEGYYAVLVELTVHRLCQTQNGEDFTPIAQCTDCAEILAWVFSLDRVEKVKAALQAIDPTLALTGYWPGVPRRDEGGDDCFRIIIPLDWNGCNAAS